MANAISEIERSLSEALIRRVSALFEEKRDEIRHTLIKEQLDSYEDGKRQMLVVIGMLLEGYMHAVHQRYAEELHRLRPGAEISEVVISSASVGSFLRDSKKFDVTDSEVADLLRRLHLPLADDLPDI